MTTHASKEITSVLLGAVTVGFMGSHSTERDSEVSGVSSLIRAKRDVLLTVGFIFVGVLDVKG